MNPEEINELRVYLRQWTRFNAGWEHWPPQEIAAALAQDADFNLIKLAVWLRTPDGELIESVVADALPPPYNYGADVLVEAVQIAARQRTRRQRLEAAAVGGLAALLVVAVRA